MAVTREDVRHVAELARLRLAPEEAEAMADQLNAILRHVDVLRELPPASGSAEADGPEPPSGSGADPAPLRADEPSADPMAVRPAAIAPAWSDPFFVVPRLEGHGDPSADPERAGE